MADAGTGAGMVAMAAASITVATIQAAAATHAADIQVASANRTADLIDARFQQMRTDFVPYREIGGVALSQLTTRLNEFTSTANPYAEAMDAEMPAVPVPPTLVELEAVPDYLFTRDQGIRATRNAYAARGLGISGAMERAVATFATGLASQIAARVFDQRRATFAMHQQRWANLTTRFTLDQGAELNAWNRLSAVVTLGQNSAAQVGNAGMSAANQTGAALQAGANGAAGGILSASNAIGGGINGMANAYSAYQQQQAYGLNGMGYTNGQLDRIDADPKNNWTAADQRAATSYDDMRGY